MTPTFPSRQRGMFLIEALIAILIFALGILGMIAMGGKAVSAQSDAQYRTEASNLADAIAGQIALNVDRSGDSTTIKVSLDAYRHQETGGNCVFNGTPIAPTTPGASSVLALLNKAGASAVGSAGLPGTSPSMQQVVVDTAQSNRVAITLCWKTPNDAVARRHTLVTYVN